MGRLKAYMPLVHEVLSSTYWAFVIVNEEAGRSGPALLRWLGYPLGYLYRIIDQVSHRPRFRPGLFYGTLALWWFLALIILVCLQAFGRSAPARRVLLHVAGVVTVSGYPLMCLNRGPEMGLWDFRGRLLAEAGMVAAFVLLCAYRRWAFAGILVAAAHFGFWAWITAGVWTVGWSSLYILLGLCAVLSWGICVRLQPESQRPPLAGAILK